MHAIRQTCHPSVARDLGVCLWGDTGRAGKNPDPSRCSGRQFGMRWNLLQVAPVRSYSNFDQQRHG
jgi:hypothetical protein